MKPDTSHIQRIMVVSNTHWDREFRRSFEKTRRRLLTMMDVTLDILEKDPAYHSFTMDGHTIMIDDYLEMRPEKRELVESLVRSGRLILGPYYTLAEEFSIGQEPLVRNLLLGRRTVEKYGGKAGTVAYTPSSWGQTGQLPQILREFGLTRMMFYRGISHHESDAEWIWQAPDGTSVLASRFALYARYNWYYQVHRPVTSGRVFGKNYAWGEFDEVPFRFSDGLAGEDLAFDLLAPAALYDKSKLKQAVLDMIEREGRHFTTPIFLAMHGHDISVAHPHESKIIADAKSLLGDRYQIEHTTLENYWNEAEKYLDRAKLVTLTGERRAYLKQGMWTFLFPGTISARTYMKQKDFDATGRLVRYAEPLASLMVSTGGHAPRRYLDRGWQFLLSNHTHDANGGCAPDIVCQDMEYRYRKAADVADIITEDAMAHVAQHLSPGDQPAGAMQYVVFNPLPFERDARVLVDLEVPRTGGAGAARAARLTSDDDAEVVRQPVSDEKSSSFVDSIWEVPRILESSRLKFFANFSRLPGLGYRVYRIEPQATELRTTSTLMTGPSSMANEFTAVSVNGNGTIDVTCRKTGRTYAGINYLLDQGETGNAWKHVAPTFDRVFNSRGATARVMTIAQGPLVCEIGAEYEFAVPVDYADGKSRSEAVVRMPVKVIYRLEAGCPAVRVRLTVDNRASDHWLRVACPTGLTTDQSWADSHFDVLSRPIPLPDSSGWVEQAFGMHPLQTFVDLTDGRAGLALLPKGLYEYEAMDDAQRTIALTLIRACRIKLAVSEEKQTELPDPGVQCPGVHTFEYAIMPHAGDWRTAELQKIVAELATPPRAAMTGRGRGDLPHGFSLLNVSGGATSVSCVKPAENGEGLIVRLFNPHTEAQSVTLMFGKVIANAARCRMDESQIEPLSPSGSTLTMELPAKKIITLRVAL